MNIFIEISLFMKKDSEVGSRLLLLADRLGLNPNQFSVQIGKDRSYLHKISKEIQSDVLRNIFSAFPQANLTWIVTGEGEPLLYHPTEALQSTDASLILRMFNEERGKVEKLEKENKVLVKEREVLKDSISKLNLENLSLKQQMGIETSPSTKAG